MHSGVDVRDLANAVQAMLALVHAISSTAEQQKVCSICPLVRLCFLDVAHIRQMLYQYISSTAVEQQARYHQIIL